jgi:ribonuclease HI
MKKVECIGLRNVIFETDSKSVVDAIHRRVNGISEFSSLIVMIKNVLSLFSNFQVKFIKRQANTVAHKLAITIVSWLRRYIFDLSPFCIDTLLANVMI